MRVLNSYIFFELKFVFETQMFTSCLTLTYFICMIERTSKIEGKNKTAHANKAEIIRQIVSRRFVIGRHTRTTTPMLIMPPARRLQVRSISPFQWKEAPVN